MNDRIFLSPPDVGPAERDALLRAFDGGWIAPVGPELTAFEEEVGALVGMHAVGLASGTAALHLALLSVGVAPGDEVVVSSFTFAASANAVIYCGARPVLVDSDQTSWNLDPELLDEVLTSRARARRGTAAVVAVDLYGQCADYGRIAAICREHEVPLVEDAAEALGARYGDRPAGSLGDVGVLSFNGNKIITTSGGGMLLAHDAATAERARYLATQARQPAIHYEHTEVGFNYRLSNLLAALGRAQLARLPAMSARRLEINAIYRRLLADTHLTHMPVPEWSRWNGWLTCVVTRDRAERDRVMAALDAEDIESRPLWKPLHLQPAFADAEAHVTGVSTDLFERGLCLPSGSSLSDADVERIAANVARSVSA